MNSFYSKISSYSALNEAFHYVKDNHGCAGADGVTIEHFESDLRGNLSCLVRELVNKIYFPLPLLQILVDKGNSEVRKLCIPTVRDRVVQRAVLNEIEPIIDREFEDCSFAYRKGRSVKQAVYKIKHYYDQGYRWVVDADIDSFFDKLNHNLMLGKVKKYIKDEDIVNLVELWIKAEVWDGRTIKVMNKGISQGSSVSPILANLFLDELDQAMVSKGYKYIRYSDDFIILCKNQDQAKQCLEFTSEKLDNMLLTLDDANLVNFEQGFEYLGVMFVRSLIMTPFDKPKKERKVFSVPEPLDMNIYMLKKKKGW